MWLPIVSPITLTDDTIAVLVLLAINSTPERPGVLTGQCWLEVAELRREVIVFIWGVFNEFPFSVVDVNDFKRRDDGDPWLIPVIHGVREVLVGKYDDEKVDDNEVVWVMDEYKADVISDKEDASVDDGSNDACNDDDVM